MPPKATNQHNWRDGSQYDYQHDPTLDGKAWLARAYNRGHIPKCQAAKPLLASYGVALGALALNKALTGSGKAKGKARTKAGRGMRRYKTGKGKKRCR